MSPVSRGRKGRRKASNRSGSRYRLVGEEQSCDCPACTGDGDELGQVVGGLITMGQLLLDVEDPTEVEVAGAGLTTLDGLEDEAFEQTFVGQTLSGLEAAAGGPALAILLAIGSVAPGRAGTAAQAAAGRLVATGVPRPRWADELGAPVAGGDFHVLGDAEGAISILTGSFVRAGREHLFVINVEPEDCGAAENIFVASGDDSAEALTQIRDSAREDGIELRTERLDPAEFRWRAENALDARAVHDGGDLALGLPGAFTKRLSGPDEDGDGLGYAAMAFLVRNRLATLPVPTKPPAPHSPDNDDRGLAMIMSQLLSGPAHSPGPLAGRLGSGGRGWPPALAAGQASKVPMPGKRKKSAGPAPVYQIKLSLRGAKPPIWRRLEVPADVSLARLHTAVQVAFGWQDRHLHVFETPYGRFGTSSENLDQRSENPVSLEQVLPEIKSRIGYTYDFGDDWEHDIVLEKILDRDPATRYPRCTGGRRAAPPEDSGGIWGYAELVEILSEPDHPEHDDRMDWLGLQSVGEFDPATFDVDAVNKILRLVR